MGIVNASIECQPIGQREGPPGEKGRDADRWVWGDPCMLGRAERSWWWNVSDSKGGDHVLPTPGRPPPLQLFSWTILSLILPSGTVL